MYRLSVNLTDEEKSILDDFVERSGLSISSYVKKNILYKSVKSTNNEMLPILADMTTNINKFQALYGFPGNSMEYFMKIREGVEQLWQAL